MWNWIRERRFVVVVKKNLRKGKKDLLLLVVEISVIVCEIDCRCGERKRGNMKCVCVVYEMLCVF